MVFCAWFQHAFLHAIVTTLHGIVGRFSVHDVLATERAGLEQKLGSKVG